MKVLTPDPEIRFALFKQITVIFHLLRRSVLQNCCSLWIDHNAMNGNCNFNFSQYFPILELIVFLQSYFHVLRRSVKIMPARISVSWNKKVEKIQVFECMPVERHSVLANALNVSLHFLLFHPVYSSTAVDRQHKYTCLNIILCDFFLSTSPIICY